MTKRVTISASGFTIVELLVVIGIIAALTALLIPAVQAAREAARRTQCQNNVKQLALAALQHQANHGTYPTGGWSYAWVGDPERGFDARQPGGWIFNILPYMEEEALWGASRGQSPAARFQINARMTRTPLDITRCPTRAQPELSPYGAELAPRNADLLMAEFVAKSDYAINAGDVFLELGPGPESYQVADSGQYQWPDSSVATGVSYLRSMVRPSDVRDGTSKTYLVGEKVVVFAEDAYDLGNDQSMYSGFDYDTCRWTAPANAPPMADGEETSPMSFGSAHAAGFFMAFADGSVKMIHFDIDPEVHRASGNRGDGGQ